MSDVYKIAVNLALTSNATSFFSAFAGQVLGAEKYVKKLEGSIGSLNKTMLAIGGGGCHSSGRWYSRHLRQDRRSWRRPARPAKPNGASRSISERRAEVHKRVLRQDRETGAHGFGRRVSEDRPRAARRDGRLGRGRKACAASSQDRRPPRQHFRGPRRRGLYRILQAAALGRDEGHLDGPVEACRVHRHRLLNDPGIRRQIVGDRLPDASAARLAPPLSTPTSRRRSAPSA